MGMVESGMGRGGEGRGGEGRGGEGRETLQLCQVCSPAVSNRPRV